MAETVWRPAVVIPLSFLYNENAFVGIRSNDLSIVPVANMKGRAILLFMVLAAWWRDATDACSRVLLLLSYQVRIS